MNNFFIKALAIFKPENMPYILSIIILVMVWLLFDARNTISDLKQQYNISNSIIDNNIKALRGEIQEMKLETGELVSYKEAFLIKLEDLEKYDEKLFNEIKKINGTISFIDSKLSITLPELIIDNNLVEYEDGYTYGLKFDQVYKDEGLFTRFKGQSTFKLTDSKILPGLTILDSLDIEVALKYGFDVVDDQYRVYAYSPSSRIKFNELSGALLLDRPLPTSNNTKLPPRLSWSIGIGYYYIPRTNSLDLGVGIGLNYSLMYWQFRRASSFNK